MRVKMQVQRSVNRRVGDKTYYKWRIDNVPPEVIEALGWADQTKVGATIENGRLVIERKQ